MIFYELPVLTLRKVDNLKYDVITKNLIAGWSSLVARQAHNLKVLGSNPSPATKVLLNHSIGQKFSFNLFLILSKFF